MTVKKADVVLVGAGIMSATLGMVLKQIDPSIKIVMIERLNRVARESTYGWNNAGTGHAAYCELNYTSADDNGNVDISRALDINASFEVTLQFWSYLVKSGALPPPTDFINKTPHDSFVWGEENIEFLKNRFEAMKAHHLFEDMKFSRDPETIKSWIPLVMEGRKPTQPVAATRVEHGSDVDFGSLTLSMIRYLQKQPGFTLLLDHKVKKLGQHDDGRWKVTCRDKKRKQKVKINTGFVFLGAGGAALPLLQKSKIPESKGYGGFPVSGQWLVCDNPEVVEKHSAKVYGKAPIGAPPMSVPHLDTRIIGGKPALLFGPFAGFTTKFLKEGSLFDLPNSVKSTNLKPIMSAGLENMDLTRYLIKEVFQSHSERVNALRNFFPEAKEEDWKLAVAGQRVQIIKKSEEDGGGKLEFGTEVICSEDGTLSALLGASPGASTAVQTMLNVVEQCFEDKIASPAWQEKLTEMIPSYGKSLVDDAELARKIRKDTIETLELA